LGLFLTFLRHLVDKNEVNSFGFVFSVRPFSSAARFPSRAWHLRTPWALAPLAGSGRTASSAPVVKPFIFSEVIGQAVKYLIFSNILGCPIGIFARGLFSTTSWDVPSF
jgi:hypothetical protein